jgi:hypothetical protein
MAQPDTAKAAAKAKVKRKKFKVLERYVTSFS